VAVIYGCYLWLLSMDVICGWSLAMVICSLSMDVIWWSWWSRDLLYAGFTNIPKGNFLCIQFQSDACFNMTDAVCNIYMKVVFRWYCSTVGS
jgi:hypothetical protein